VLATLFFAPYAAGAFAGALLVTLFFTRMFELILQRFQRPLFGVFLSNGLSYAASAMAAAYSRINDLTSTESPHWAEALPLYVVPQLLWLANDLWLYRQKTQQGPAVREAGEEAYKADPREVDGTIGGKARSAENKKSSLLGPLVIIAGSAAIVVAFYGAIEMARDYERRQTEGRIELATTPPQVGSYEKKTDVTSNATQLDPKLAVNEQLQRAALELKQKLPMVLDEKTTLADVRVEKNNFIYVYQVDPKAEPMDLNAMEEGVRPKVCSSIMKRDIENGVSYTYEYRSSNTKNKLLGSFSISTCP